MLKSDITEQIKNYIYSSSLFDNSDEFKERLENLSDCYISFDDGIVSSLDNYFGENHEITYEDMIDNSGWDKDKWRNYLTNQVNSISSVVLDRIENNEELFEGWE